jgi:hypothetical protein
VRKKEEPRLGLCRANGSGGLRYDEASEMRSAALLVFAITLAALPQAGISQDIPTVQAPPFLYFPNANSRPTYFSIHHFNEARAVSDGTGVKVGILDHSFGFQIHEGLYAGGCSFHTDDWGDSFDTGSHHGYWMAKTLKEVAPGVEVYALGTYSSDEEAKVDAMIQAIDWAIDNDLDVLTYSAGRFSPQMRERLDVAVDRALANGISTTFIHYPHPGNILPTWLGPISGDDEREPDLNILQYDYSVVFTQQYAEWMETGSDSGYRPFLSISSTSPVTAGAVAILKSAKADLTPEELKKLLMETSYEMEFEGRRSARTMDVRAAVQVLMGLGERR